MINIFNKPSYYFIKYIYNIICFYQNYAMDAGNITVAPIVRDFDGIKASLWGLAIFAVIGLIASIFLPPEILVSLQQRD